MSDFTFDGGCACGSIRYRMDAQPMIVHCCHCTWCQRETGSSYVVNALVESERLSIQKGEPTMIATPSASGKGQNIRRCPDCHVALWSHYAGFGDAISFVRVGTLDEAGRLPPDVHIFTTTRQPWVQIPDHHRAFDEFYELREQWPDESRARLRQVLSR